MPYLKVYIHAVWSTKNRMKLLNSPELRAQIFEHIKDNAQQKGIYLVEVNGHSDHTHCLLSLGADQTISKVTQLMKGESSFWINKKGLCQGKFHWQEEYYAESVGPDRLAGVKDYIRNQEEHHSRRTFQEEYNDLICRWDKEKLG